MHRRALAGDSFLKWISHAVMRVPSTKWLRDRHHTCRASRHRCVDMLFAKVQFLNGCESSGPTYLITEVDGGLSRPPADKCQFRAKDRLVLNAERAIATLPKHGATI